MDAKIGSDSSYIWRSICNTRVLFRDVLEWNIGDETRINVCFDNWSCKPQGENISPCFTR